VISDEERQRLRQTFNQAADSYQRARPDYPAELFDALVAAAGLAPGDRLLEVGCATGKATLPLARRGFRISCVELGAGLAAAARRNLAGLDVEVAEGRFEDWRPPADVRFDLVFAATAWHWIDPAVGYRAAWRALRPGGHLAFWSAEHVVPDGGDPFFAEIQEVYDEINEGLPPGWAFPRPGELADSAAQIEASGLFHVTDIRHFDWERVYDAESYIDLLNTFSGHLDMADWQRQRLYGEIRRRLALRPDGLLRRHWGAVLHVARRRDDARAVNADAYVLEPVAALDTAAVDSVRRIYEDGFPARLRADFASLTDHRENGEDALALVHGRQPCGFAMLRRLGGTGWTFLRYFAVDQPVRGRGLGGIMWDQLTGRLRAEGQSLLVFDVEDPGEAGCGPAESQVRLRRIGFYERHGAARLPVRGYRTPHKSAGGDGWSPMLLMAAPLAVGATAPGASEVRAIVSAVYEHRWRLEPGHPWIAATEVVGQDPEGC
jgi:SAM-dependent methyltransferase/ribosomal protein S18 acetylase RimI-like enzyme